MHYNISFTLNTLNFTLLSIIRQKCINRVIHPGGEGGCGSRVEPKYRYQKIAGSIPPAATAIKCPNC